MKITKILFTTLAMVLVASAAFASGDGAGADIMSAKAYATALGMGIAAGLCGIAQGMGRSEERRVGKECLRPCKSLEAQKA